MLHSEKQLIVMFFIFFFSFSVSAVSIDEQIEAIKKASPQERVRLMNEFKRKLVQMNRKQRLETITKMQEQINHTHHVRNSWNKPNIQTQQKHLQQMQMQNNEHMDRMQNMIQHGAGEQLKNIQNIKPDTPLHNPQKPYSFPTKH